MVAILLLSNLKRQEEKIVVEQGLGSDNLRVWRLLIGVLVGTISTVALYSINYLYTTTGYCVSCSTAQTVQTLLVVLVGTLGSAGVGALAGKVAGRFEVPVAVGSGIIGLIILGYLPDFFADPVFVLFSAIPFLILSTVGGMLVFFARRTDLR